MYDIKNLNIWKANNRYRGLNFQIKVLEMDISKRREVTMSNKCQAVLNEIMSLVPTVNFKDIKEKTGKLRFPMYINQSLMETDLEVLELSIRASNSLHRAGYRTIGELVEAIESGDDLKNIRSCGTKTIDEIMGKLFYYQYSLVDGTKKAEYIKRLLELNQ